MKRRPVTDVEAQARLEALCARSEKCTYELRTKLAAWQFSPGDSEQIINRLVSTRFVDDARFARAFVRDKVRFERRGRMWLHQALRAKRIGREDITAALELIDEEEYLANLRATLTLKLRQNPDLSQTFEGRTKLYRYGLTRGYESQLVSRVIHEILTSPSE